MDLKILHSAVIENLALFKICSQSSDYGSAEAGLATDGNTDGRYQNGSLTHTSGQEEQPWWQVDLGCIARPISVIELYNRDSFQERLSEYYVLISDSDFGNDTLEEAKSRASYMQLSLAAVGSTTRIFIPEIQGRYVRVQLAGDDPLSLAEVKVLACANSAPSVFIDTPAVSADYASGEIVMLSGEGTDREDGALAGSNLRWSSDIQGVLGTGSYLQIDDLTIGDHTITITAVDSEGLTSETSVTITVSGTSQIINLSEGKPASQSSDYGESFADRAVDGNTDGDWNLGSVSHTAAQTNAWWQVDLGKLYELDSIVLFNRTIRADRMANYYVFISDTPFTSDDPAVVAEQGANVLYQESEVLRPTELDVRGIYGRYVRIQLTGDEPLTIAEVQVFGSDTIATENIALGAAASQSTDYENAYANLAVDGTTDGNYYRGSMSHTGLGGNQPWWTVDLGERSYIESINIYNRNTLQERLSDYYIFISDQPFSSDDIVPTAEESSLILHLNTAAGRPTVIDCGGIYGRYVRIQLFNNDPLHIAEVEVIGTRTQ